MSIKVFHIVFVTLAVLLAAGCAVALLHGYFVGEKDSMHLLLGSLAATAAVVLIAYGIWFLRKIRKIILL